MKKRVYFCLLLAGLLVSHWSLYKAGEHFGNQKLWRYFVSETEKAEAKVTFGRYLQFRYIAEDIKAGRDDHVKCGIDIGASTYFELVRECYEDDACRPAIEGSVLKNAPEIISGADLPFEYIRLRKGIRYCDEITPELSRLKE